VASGDEAGGETDYVLNSAFWLNGQALGFPVQFDLVLKHLRQDMRDDWYFDCLQYDDLFKDPAEAKRIIIALLQDWNGVYQGTRSVVRNIPKKGYGERYGLETDFFDRFVYQAICSFLIPFFDPLLGHRVLSYRYEPAPLNPKYLFKNKIDRWFTFEGVTLTFRRARRHLLVTDLSNFFENISRVQIIKALEEIRGSPPDVRRRQRQVRSRPMVEDLRGAIDDALRRLSPKSAMAKALAYGRKRWDALSRFLDEGTAEIDNNAAERAMRTIAIGRKNWLFAGSKAGGERAAAIYTVIETCKLSGVEPQAYIADVIEKVAGNWPAARWDELMPWNWRPDFQTIAEAA